MDLRHAWRSIVKMPVLSAVVVVSLGIGIGVNTAVFSWVQAVVLRPLPGVPDVGRFRLIEPRAETGSYPGVSWQEYGDLRERLRSFPELLAFRMAPFTLGAPGRSERIFGLLVSGNYFSALGMRPALGRFLRPDEVDACRRRAGRRDRARFLADALRRRAGRARADAPRQRSPADHRRRRAQAVSRHRARPQFRSLGAGDARARASGRLARARGSHDARLPGHGTPAVAAPRSRRRRPSSIRRCGSWRGRIRKRTRRCSAEVLPFWQAPRGPQRMLATMLAILQGIMLVLLLAVCGNTANLVLARASTRQREIGVRLALGAGPWRVASLILAENILLGLIGAALGAAIAVWATEALRAVPLIGAFPIKFQTSLDAREPRLRHGPRRRLRPDVRHRPGASAFARRAANRRCDRAHGRPGAAACGTR